MQALLLTLVLLRGLISTAGASGVSIAPSVTTCPSRTVNYITHSLPQQCLTSSRTTSTTPTIDSLPNSLAGSETLLKAESARQSSSNSSAPSISQSQASATGPGSSSSWSDSVEATTKTTAAVTSTTTSTLGESDDASPLEDGNFLSFEDWKRENLKRAGQSEHLGKGPGGEAREPKKRPKLVHDSLDSLGDDAEIDLDFSGFVSEGFEAPVRDQSRGSPAPRPSDTQPDPGRSPLTGLRSKDAGTTCKERSNYASFDCAANVLKTNPEAQGALAVLGKNKDSYMLNECSAKNKFIIIELCDDISIDTIVVANFEFFSSIFREFRVSVSDKYPIKIDKWKTIGTFEARNSRDVQAFLVENPMIWARYLRIEFLTHYGNEYYCPVSLIRVHGITMVEEYKHDVAQLLNEEDDDVDASEDIAVAVDGLVPEAVAEQLIQKLDASTDEAKAQGLSSSAATNPPQSNLSSIPSEGSSTNSSISKPISPSSFAQLQHNLVAASGAVDTCEPATSQSTQTKNMEDSSTKNPVRSTSTDSSPSSPHSDKNVATTSADGNSTGRVDGLQNGTAQHAVDGNSVSANATSSTTVGNSTKLPTAAQPPPPAPTMQESFFRSVQKRLQMLEANSSLSLQYIEDQSRALRDAFQKVEQKQMAKTTAFLDYLNGTVLKELRDFRTQYDQLWQSTVIELEVQRERYQQENLAINTRLGVLADEVIFQKRMSILQTILIVVCLGLVLFSKGNVNSYLDLTLVQSMLSRSPSSKWLNIAGMDSPSSSSPLKRTKSAPGMRSRSGILKTHRRMSSEDSVEDSISPTQIYTPPSPVSYEGAPTDEDVGKEVLDQFDDPRFDPGQIQRPSTSPPALPGIEEARIPDLDAVVQERSIDATLLDSSPPPSSRLPTIVIDEAPSSTSRHLKWELPDG